MDANGRVVQEQVTGLGPVRYAYDSLRRLSSITQGTGAAARLFTLTYNTKHELVGLTDPLSRTGGFAYDLMDRSNATLRTLGAASLVTAELRTPLL